MKKYLAVVSALVIAIFGNSAIAQNAENATEWLFVHAAETAEMTSETTLAVPVQREIFAFTDRPNRMHGYMTAHAFVSLWDEGEEDSFSVDPPNAVLTWRDGDDINEVVVVIIASEVSDYGRGIVYTVQSEVPLPAAGVPLNGVSLFIDSMCIGVCGNKNSILF